MSMNKQPENVFCTSHVLSVLGVLYITTLSPAIDKAIAEGLTRKEIGHLINSTLVALVAGSLKMLDKDAYTPKFLPGRNKDKAFNNIKEQLIEPTTNIIKETVKEVVDSNINNINNDVNKAINTVTTDTINTIVPNNNTLQNSAIRAILPNVVNSYTDSITSNLASDVSNTVNNAINDTASLFKTRDVLKKKNNDSLNNTLSDLYINPLESNTDKKEEIKEDYLIEEEEEEIRDINGILYHSSLIISNVLTNIVLTANVDTYYKKELKDSNNLKENEKIKVEKGTTTYISSYSIDKETNHISFVINDLVFYAFIPHITIIDDDKTINLNNTNEDRQIDTVTKLRPTIQEAEKVYDSIITNKDYKDFIKCLDTFNINTPLDVCHFLSHCAHESGGLRYMKELGDEDYFSKNYDYREDLGNIYEGDGARFSGVSPIQLTGRYNYQAFADFIGDQRVMEGVNYVAANYKFQPSGFWWYKNDMSNFINNEGADIYDTTKRVNGGLNGIEDRIRYFEKAKQIFNLQ